MAGPKLELFRFGMYVFFPILIMAHYGDPDWYNKVDLTADHSALPDLMLFDDFAVHLPTARCIPTT